MDFCNIDYLQSGTEKQQQAYKTLVNHHILTDLAVFDPILVGTIPINIDTEKSDLDIICYAPDKKLFKEILLQRFQQHQNFHLRESSELNAIIANFEIDGFEVEIFGQPIPTRQQLAYRHMLIEYQILEERGEAFRKQVIELKQKGLKTEPAFAAVLELQGDPYLELLKYEK